MQGLHFFNPVPVMVYTNTIFYLSGLTTWQKLVELISALQTTPETLDRARAFAIACGKGMAMYHYEWCRRKITDLLCAYCRSHNVQGCTWFCFKRASDALHQ